MTFPEFCWMRFPRLRRSLTHTSPSGAVQSQTPGTLASERALGVHTAAICTHAREHFTLINVYRDGDILGTLQGETHPNRQ